MSKRSLLPVVLLLMMVLLPGCTRNTAEVESPLDREFILSPGQSAAISGEDLRIKFIEVIEDSRCPKNVVCIWAGRVSCVTEITKNGSPYRMVLTEPGLSDQSIGEAYQEYQLKFHVEPYPAAGKEIPPGDYRLLMSVSRKS